MDDISKTIDTLQPFGISKYKGTHFDNSYSPAELELCMMNERDL